MKTSLGSLLAATALVALCSIGSAEAGTIGFQIDTTVHAGPNVRVELTVRHTGDEGARDVQPTFELLGARQAATKREYLGPGTSTSWEATIRDEPLAPGNYVLVIHLAYADANAYPFEVLATSPFPVSAAPAPAVTGSFEIPTVPTRGSVAATLKLAAPPIRGRIFNVQLVAPSGVSLTPEFSELEFAADGTASIQATVTNRNLLVGTGLEVFALISGNQDDRPQTDLVRGRILISEPEDPIDVSLFVKLAIAMATLLVVLQLIRWRYPR